MHRARPSPATRELRCAVALFALGAACAAVLWSARPRQALLPPVHHARGLPAWVQHHDPVLTVVALARGLGLALAAYLVVTSGLALVAGLTRSHALSRLARAVTVPALRRLLPATLGVGLVLAATAASSPGATAGSPSPGAPGRGPTPTTTTVPSARADLLTRLPESPPATALAPSSTELAPTPTTSPPPPPPPPPRSDDIARFHLDAPPPSPSPTTAPSASRHATAPPPSRSSQPTPRTPAARRRTTAPPRRPSVPHTDDSPTWTVRPGDHLWGIAAATLRHRLGRAPTDAEVEPYWRRLLDLNRSRLVDPGNPDLIFPTQVFDLPR